MKSSTPTVVQVACTLLVFLWVYAAVSKIIEFNTFKLQLLLQPLPRWFPGILVFLLPALELVIAGFLLIDKYVKIGFILSGLLLLLFTVYIILILADAFGHVPCACGGLIQELGWKLHLVFNLFFLLLSIFGISITNRERRAKFQKAM